MEAAGWRVQKTDLANLGARLEEVQKNRDLEAEGREKLEEWRNDKKVGLTEEDRGEVGGYAKGMRFVAQELVLAARKIAEDPFAGSPFMERAVEEGLAIEGGKIDDISVVAAICKKRKG